MFLLEFGIYAAFALLLSLLAHAGVKRSGWLYLYVAFFALFAGVRWRVGSDWMYYARKFWYGVDDSLLGAEPLWRAFVNLFHHFDLHWSLGLGACALLQCGFITLALRRMRWILVALPLVMLGGRYWGDMMGAVRQMMVACAMIWMLPTLLQRNGWWKWLSFTAIASLIHTSSIILAPLALIPALRSVQDKFSLTQNIYCFTSQHSRIVQIVILLVCVMVGRMPLNAVFAPAALTVMRSVGSVTYIQRFEAMAADPMAQSLAFGPMMVAYLLTALAIIWFAPVATLWCRRCYGVQGERLFRLWYYLSFLYAAGYFTVCCMGHIMIRPWLYLAPVQMVTAAATLCALWQRNPLIHHRRIQGILFALLLMSSATWDIYKSIGKEGEFVLYKTSLFSPAREGGEFEWFRKPPHHELSPAKP